jgi:multidrug efflux system outer membrane protein
MKKYLFLVSATLLFSGCSLITQDPNLPTVKLPQSAESNAAYAALLKERWWENFHDKELNVFVEYALKNNSDLQKATINIDRFKQFLSIKKNEQIPELTGYGSGTHNETNKHTPPMNSEMSYDVYELGLNASFEIDIFGKRANATRAAYEDMMQEYYVQAFTYQQVVSDSIIAYYGLKSNQSLYNEARSQYYDQQKTYNNIKRQYKSGFIDRGKLLQEESLLESMHDTMLAQKEILDNYKVAVAILIGKTPDDVFNATSIINIKNTTYSPNIPVPAYLPSNILNKRADIQAAEAKVRSTAFSVSVARGAYFPTISLTGALGYASGDLNTLVKSQSSDSSGGVNLFVPILNLGQIKATVENAKNDQKLALIEYKDAVRNAFGDIKKALVTYNTNKERLKSQQKRYYAISTKNKIAKDQYKSGYISYLEYLDARREASVVAMEKERIKFEALKSAVNVYYNLGGGFNIATQQKTNR